MLSRLRFITVITAALTTLSAPVFAASAGMPWEGPLSRIVTSVTGPVARAVGIFAIISAGVGVAVSEGGSGVRKVVWVVFGLCIAFSAATWGIQFLGFGGGLLV